MIEYKTCSACKLSKLLSEFSRKHGKCKSCINAESKKQRNKRVCWGCHQTKSRDEFVGAERYCIFCREQRDTNIKVAKREYTARYRRKNPEKIKEKNHKKYRRKYYGNDPKTILMYRVQGAKKRAKEKGIDYDIDLEFILGLYNKQDGKCGLTNIEFDYTFDDSFSKRPFSPSIDRIDSKLGYTKNNVRLVCIAVNVALSDFGDVVFDRICEARIRYKNNQGENT